MIDWSTCPAVESIPGKHSGDWLFTESRLPVYSLFENLAAGASVKDFMEWFHPVDEWKVASCVAARSRLPENIRTGEQH